MTQQWPCLLALLSLACAQNTPEDDVPPDTDLPEVPLCPEDSELAVETADGCILGTLWGDGEAFLGIPYAAPPVGSLRWVNPQPHPGWSTPHDGSQFGAMCVQAKDVPLTTTAAGDGEEDCLTLNIFRPAGTDANSSYPILFFTHGGSYENGSGDSELYTANPVLAESAIVVTHNYRLGPFGFLVDSHELKGNQGLFDSYTALQWVVDNAENFGGNPDQLMVFGESAGAMTTCAFLTSPLTEGLFSAAFMQSIGCGWLQTPASAAAGQGERMASTLGCTAGDLSCMQAVPAAEIVAALGPDESYFAIVDEIFVPEPVGQSIYTGAFHRVPVVAGVNADEGSMFVHHLGIDTPASLEENLRTTGGYFGINDLDTLISMYSVANYGDPQRAYDQFYGDIVFHCMTRFFLSNASEYTDTYAYYFTHEPSWIPFYPSLDGWGAYHSAELTYVFGTQQELLPEYEQEFSRDLTDMWLSVAQQQPTLPSGAPWTPFSESDSWWTDGGKMVELTPGGFEPLSGVKKAQCDFIADQWWGS